MLVKLTEKQSIFLQALATTELMVRLDSIGFLNSEYYDEQVDFEGDDIVFRQVLAVSGLGNPATLQMFLYTLLVMPKELLKDENSDFIPNCEKRINQLFSGIDCTIKTSYRGENQNDKSTIKFYTHIRNAVAHAKCTYNSIDGRGYVTFRDDNMKGKHEYCEIKMATFDVGTILNELNTQIKLYVKSNAMIDYGKGYKN